MALDAGFLTPTIRLEKGALRANAGITALMRPLFLSLARVIGGPQGVGTLSLGGAA